MNNRDRFLCTMNFKKADDRLPMIEWATWWDKTFDRWKSEGLPSHLEPNEAREYLGLDMVRGFLLLGRDNNYPKLPRGKGIVKDMASYMDVREKYLYPRTCVERLEKELSGWKTLHEKGDLIVYIQIDGFFWFPRGIMGIEEHLYAFYDQPELLHRIGEDQAEYTIRVVDEFCKIMQPEYVHIAEDMSYNQGPMISKEQFDAFILPYYKHVLPFIKKKGIIPIVDSDGQIEPMIPWLMEAGVEGILPMERRPGVDVARIRNQYPQLKMIGGYDKRAMSQNKDAMRAEFERLLPVMRSGGYIPSCDHQTPPEVSLENYKTYIALLREYCEKAVM